jgi:hypothetical protein
MKRTLVLLLGLTLVASAAQAQPTQESITADVQVAPMGEFRAAWPVGAKPGNSRREAVWAYNTYDCPSCFGGVNLAYSDPDCYTGGDCDGELYILPMGYHLPAGDTTPLDPWDVLPYHALGYDDGAGNVFMLDAYADDYQADESIWGDIGMLHPLVAFTGIAWTFNDYGSGLDKSFHYNQLWLSPDGAELYGRLYWRLDAFDGENLLHTLNLASIDDPLDPAVAFEIPYKGLLVFDYDNETLEGYDDGGAWNVFVGGDMDDAAFPYPPDLYETGYNDLNNWFAFNMDDFTDYSQAITTGYLVGLTWYSLAPAHPSRMAIPQDSEPCAGDLDGDGDTDQSDLGILLAVYEINGDGDLDGDGDTDQADLALLLSEYECGV